MKLMALRVILCLINILACCSGVLSLCKSLKLNSWNNQFNRKQIKGAALVTMMHVKNRASHSTCDRNKSYGFEGNTIWVDHGCRAVFSLCYKKSKTVKVSCSSRNYTSTTCKVRTKHWKILYVGVLKQKSKSPCHPNYSYYHNEKTITVSKGCRALFKVTLIE